MISLLSVSHLGPELYHLEHLNCAFGEHNILVILTAENKPTVSKTVCRCLVFVTRCSQCQCWILNSKDNHCSWLSYYSSSKRDEWAEFQYASHLPPFEEEMSLACTSSILKNPRQTTSIESAIVRCSQPSLLSGHTPWLSAPLKLWCRIMHVLPVSSHNTESNRLTSLWSGAVKWMSISGIQQPQHCFPLNPLALLHVMLQNGLLLQHYACVSYLLAAKCLLERNKSSRLDCTYAFLLPG